MRIFQDLHRISLSGTPLNAGSMQSLSELKRLIELNLSHTKLPDDALKHVVGMFYGLFGGAFIRWWRLLEGGVYILVNVSLHIRKVLEKE